MKTKTKFSCRYFFRFRNFAIQGLLHRCAASAIKYVSQKKEDWILILSLLLSYSLGIAFMFEYTMVWPRNWHTLQTCVLSEQWLSSLTDKVMSRSITDGNGKTWVYIFQCWLGGLYTSRALTLVIRVNWRPLERQMLLAFASFLLQFTRQVKSSACGYYN